LEWIDENLARGIEPTVIVSILASKGFHPHRNLALMQRIISWKAFDSFLEKYPDFDVNSGNTLDVHFKEWVIEIANRGVDGEILFKVLEDRCVDLRAQYPHFTQKILNNELGTLHDVNGRNAQLLDFWLACEKGYLDEVLIYCNCNMPLDEEKVGRHNSDVQRPLGLAAMNGHVQVIEALIKYGADINAIDRKGRTALHYAAWRGHKNAISTLLDHGAMIFQGDFQNNTALHIAAMANHYDAVDHLAFRSQEFTRSVCADKYLVRPGCTFAKLAEEVYELMQEKKLNKYDTRRFEKDWLAEAANIFVDMMDTSVKHMLSKTCKEIADDVLNR
jgi:hypothetical protein